MKRALVTGADGFIGSHLTELLVKSGFSVRAFAHYNSFNSLGWLEDIECLGNVEVMTGDIRDAFLCNQIAKGVDVIFNLAALIAIPYSYIAPSSYVETNINGALNICQAALKNDVGRVVQISTSEVYGSARYVPIDEKHPLQPQSPYSASKIGADAVAMSYFHAFGLPVSVARPFNTYGPRQSARAVIPTIITQIAAGEMQIKLGDVTPTRDFNFVSDTCDGMLAVAACPQAVGETINIGSNTEISIAAMLELVRVEMGSDAKFINDNQRLRPSTSEVSRLWCDNTKLRTLTGFESRVSLADGLRLTIDWFRRPEQLSKYKPSIYCI